MSTTKIAPVSYLPTASFLLELHSERMTDALFALSDAGFTVTYIRGSNNRYRIGDKDDNQDLHRDQR